MNEPRRRKAEELFQRAMDSLPEQRSAYLDECCATDPGLRAEVDTLLANVEYGQFVSLRAVDLLDETDSELVGQQVGPYRLLEMIGEGGFGVVYLAQQERPVRRRIALKIIKLGMDTKQVIARFEAERQALAMMEHPNIATVFDAGATETGRPYFVMELVEGVAITEYCDQHRLSTRQRIQLFTNVCRAVQHAHQKGVIHRDIKPSNVLVTFHDGVPSPKIIDFGIAKAMHTPLTDKTFFTSFRQFVGTPEYVSPEQAEMGGLDVDTRSDIYSLGVLLYELLTGTTPFDSETLRNATYSEILHSIREQPAVTPSRRLGTWGAQLSKVANARGAEPRALSKLIRGDLDWIVMKALEKDRTRRYETAEAMAADLERHLRCEPVLAGPPSAMYLFRKAVIRHKTVFAFVASLFILIVCFGIWMGFLYAQADRARALAEANLVRAHEAEDRAKAEADFMHELLASVDPSRAQGREVSVRFVLDEASKRLDEGWLDAHPDVQAAIRLTIGSTYYSLGLYPAAQTHLEAAEKAYTKRLGPEHPDTLRSRSALALVLDGRGMRAEAEALLRSTVETQARIVGPEHPDTLKSVSALGTVLRQQIGRLPEAERIHRETLAIQRRLFGDEHVDTLDSMVRLGAVLARQMRLAEAEPLLRQALEAQRRILGNEHPDTSRTINSLGFVLEEQRKFAQAEALYRESWETCRRILGAEHRQTHVSIRNLIRVLRAQGKSEELRGCVAEQITVERKLADRPDADAGALNSYAWLLLTCEPAELRDPDAALAAAQRAVELTRGTDASILDTLARAYEMTGDIDLAVEMQRKAVALAQSSGSKEPSLLEYPLVEYLWKRGDMREAADFYRDSLSWRLDGQQITDAAMADSLYLLGEDLADRRDYQLAEPLVHMCLAIRETNLPEGHALTTNTVSLLASILAGQGRFAEAEPLFLNAYERIAAIPDASVADKRLLLEHIIEFYEAWNRPEKVAEWRSKVTADEDM